MKRRKKWYAAGIMCGASPGVYCRDRKRTKFSKYIKKFGHRLQYSLYEIDNSDRILNNIITDIKNRFEKEFDQTDAQQEKIVGLLMAWIEKEMK